MKSVNTTKRAGALILVASMALSLFGCSMFSKKDVLAAAKEVAENIEDFDADKLLDLSTLSRSGDKAEELQKGLNGEYLDENTKKFCTAVRKTIKYEIIEDSFTAKGNEASVEIEFKMADYKELLEDDYKNIDELVKAVSDCDDTIKVTFEAQFVKEDGEWLLDNLMSSSFLKIFAFMDADIGALAVDLTKIVDKTTWQNVSGDSIKNTKDLILLVDFKEEASKLKGKGIKMTYTVSKDGKDVYTSKEVEIGSSLKIRITYNSSLNPNAELRSGYLAAGKYTIRLNAEDGTELCSADINVQVATTTTTTTTTSGSKPYVFSNANFASMVMTAGWTNIDNKRVSAAGYGSDATAISFQMQVKPEQTENVYFAFFYGATVSEASSIKTGTDTPIVSGTGKIIVNDKGSFYALGLKPKAGQSFKSGFYVLAIYSEDKQTLYGVATCQVLTKPASDYNR